MLHSQSPLFISELNYFLVSSIIRTLASFYRLNVYASEIAAYLCWWAIFLDTVPPQCYLHNAYTDSKLCYSLLALQSQSPTSKNNLDVARNSCFRMCLGLSKSSSCVGTVAEAKCFPLDILSIKKIKVAVIRLGPHFSKEAFSEPYHHTKRNWFAHVLGSIPLAIPTQARQIMPLHYPS